MDKGTKNALLYTAGLAAVYLGYRYYKKQQRQCTAAIRRSVWNDTP